MKNVNLLPDWYLQQQRQTGNLRIHMIAMLVIGGVMVLGTGFSKARLRTVENQQNDLARQAASVGDPEPELRKEQAELERLRNLQLAYRELGNTVPMSAVIQQMQNDMSKGMALSRVAVDVHPEPVKGAPPVGAVKAAPKLHDVAHLTVVGVAPNDVQIAQFIGKLSINPLFSEVSLNFTRTEILKDRSVRRFEIQMQMDLEALSAEDPDSAPKSVAQGEAVNAG